MSLADKPRLAYVVNALHPGGTEKLVVEMSIAFAADYDVFVVCMDEPGAWASDLRARNIPVYCLWRQPGLDLSMAWKLARIFRRLRVDLVHAHQCTPWFYSALARYFHSRPRLLLEEHGRFYPEADAPKRRLFNRLLIVPRTHRFVAVSADIRARLDRYEGVPARRIDVIYNGTVAPEPISPERRAQLRTELGVPGDGFLVGTVGRLDPIKNLPMFIAAVVRAKGRIPRLYATIVGDGPMYAAVRGQIEEAGASDYIHMTGYRADAKQLTQCFELFVLASFSEGTSMALLEAMATGVAVAVTKVGGNPEVVTANETGWMVPSDDAEALAGAFIEAAERPERREGFASAARRRFAERFAFAAMVDRYRDIYAGLGVPVVRQALAKRVEA